MKSIYNGKYSKVKKIGGGSFGFVYLVENIDTHKQYAMKKFYLDNLKEDSVIKQFNILKSLSSSHFVEAVEHFIQKDNHYLITEYYANNLYDYVPKHLSMKTIKSLIYQLTKAIQYLHNNNYIHRDIKPDNILLDKSGNIKITDFDLVRQLPQSKEEQLTKNVVTLYYRAPEIFYGDVHYGKGVDVWSIGCVFGELITGEPLFKGRSELDTLGKIISFIGTPCEENWEGVSELPNFLPFKVCEGNMKTVMEGKVSNSGIELLKGMLTLDPKKRFSCEEILGHKFFEEDEGVATLEEVVKEMGLK
jgi:serine/threonine protein kinase